MKYIYLLLLIPCLLSSAIVCGQSDDSQQKKDSLRRVIAVTQGEEKLNAYMHLAVAYYFESSDELKMDTMLSVYSEMDREARKQKNVGKRGIIRYNILHAFKNAGNFDEIFKRTPEYLNFLEKEEEWFLYYNAYTTLVDAYLLVYQFDKALAEAQKMYDKAQSFKHDDGMAQALYAIYTRQSMGMCYGRFYIAKNELDKAEYYYNKIDSAIQTNIYKIR